ncbi:hypothetical protein ACIBF7_09290 [Nonomuraea sp. NPDC050478]|uniref:hypothetical protein n=1 Tax=Nonomuraea sp. NPDC050478 TaxID=3364365 RepID=UPI0037A3885E
MRSSIRSTIAAAIALPLVFAASPASAATSESAAYWNDRPVAKAWFNSGTHNMSKGRNSFTLKVEEGATEAGLYWERPSVSGSGQIRRLYGSGNEVSFSISGAVSRRVQIWYQVCGKINGKSYCGPGRFDWIQ